MKALFLIIIHFFFLTSAIAGTCSSISRTNFSSNQVLTSASLNTQFNDVFGAANDLDGGCVTDGTLEAAALNASEFAPMLNGVQRGCKVEYSDAATVTISKCQAAVNGNFVTTTSSTSATWGCSGCASESASTEYFVYIKDGSSGSTLTPLISTTSPNADGYDGSNNFIVGRFYNNGSSDIDQYSIDQWSVNEFRPQGTGWIAYTPTTQGYGTISSVNMYWKREGDSVVIQGVFTNGTVSASEAQIGLPSGLIIDSIYSTVMVAGMLQRNSNTDRHFGLLATSGDTYLNVGYRDSVGAPMYSPQAGNTVGGNGEITAINAKIKVAGWGN